MIFFFKQKTAYEMRISDWSSDVCSSDLAYAAAKRKLFERAELVTAVINRDDACGREWIAAQRSRIDVIAYGIEGETPDLPHLIARELTLDGQGISFVVDSHLGRASIRSRLLGRFNFDNRSDERRV